MANLNDTIKSLNNSLEGISDKLDKMTNKFNTSTSNMAEATSQLADNVERDTSKIKDSFSNNLGEVTDKLDDFSEVSVSAEARTRALTARYVELENQADKLTTQYQEGKISEDSYLKSLEKIEVEANKIREVFDKQGKELDELTASYRENKKAQEASIDSSKELDANVQKIDIDFGKAGAAASAALGGMSLLLRSTNPVLSQAVGSLQKCAPLLAEIATAAKKGGAALKSAFASTGIGLLVVAITETISLIMTMKERAEDAADAAQKKVEEMDKKSKKYIDELNAGYGEFNDQVIANGQYLDEWAQDYLVICGEIKKVEQDLTTLEQLRREALHNGHVEEAKWYEREQRAGTERLKNLKQELLDVATNRKSRKQMQDELKKDEESQKKALEDSEAARKKASEDYKARMQKEKEELKSLLLEYSEFYKHKSEVDELREAVEKLNKAYVDGKIPAKEYFSALDGLVDASLALNDVDVDLTDPFKDLGDDFFSEFKENLESTLLSNDLQNNLDKVTEAAVTAAENTKYSFTEIMASVGNTITDYASQLTNIFSTVTDSISNMLEVQLEAGDITEEDYNRQKEALKAFSIAEIIANAALGIASTWTAYSEKSVAEGGVTAPINAVLAGAQTAAQIASAIAGIAAINSESVSGLSTSVSTPTATVSTSDMATTTNTSYQDVINAMGVVGNNITSAVSESQPVLVVDDLNKVQSNMRQVKSVASF